MGGCERCQNFCWRLFWQVFIKEMGSSGKVSRSGSLAGKGNFGEELPHKSIVNNRKTTGPPFSAKLNFSHFETLVLVRCHLKVKHVLYIHEHTESEQNRCFVTWHLLGESWTQIVSGCFQDTPWLFLASAGSRFSLGYTCLLVPQGSMCQSKTLI